MFKAYPIPESPPMPMSELRLGSDSQVRLDGGVSYKYIESQLNDNQSPYMINMNANDRGSLTKRKGQEYVYSSSLGSGGINGAFGRVYKNKKVFTWGTKMYTQTGTSAPVEVFSGLANAKGIFFAFNDKLYYLNGTDYVQWDGTTAAHVTGYIPTVIISSTPAGAGTTLESFNLLSKWFISSFSGDGTATAYQLPTGGLDADLLTASTNGGVTYDKTEPTHFTVNRTTGVVTWLSAPATGVNNVLIKAAKTNSGYAERIKNCTIAIDYGGENDTRVFLSGNPNYRNRVFRCGVGDPTYFPDDAFQNVGTDFEAITGFAKHSDKLVMLKERSVFFCVFTSNEDGSITFPTFPINSAVGCDMPGSIQIIDNNIVFGSSETGLHVLLKTQVKDESVVRPISGNINGNYLRPGLFDESKADLQAASSVDAEGKYWLCIGNKAYVWDYELSPYVNTGNLDLDQERLTWFPYTNINASCWVQIDRELFYGDRSTGQLVVFQEDYNDFGQPIDGVWRSKLFNFNLPDYLKTITEVWFTTRAGSYSDINIKYINDNGESLASEEVKTSSFSWARFAWDTFSWAVSKFAPTIRLKPKIKKVIYFQIEFSNNNLNENLSILSLIIRYLTVKKVK